MLREYAHTTRNGQSRSPTGRFAQQRQYSQETLAPALAPRTSGTHSTLLRPPATLPTMAGADSIPSALLWTAVGCTLASCWISLWSILRHLHSYQRPVLQRLVIRIMCECPSLQKDSWGDGRLTLAFRLDSDDTHLLDRQPLLPLEPQVGLLYRPRPRFVRGARRCPLFLLSTKPKC